MQEEYIWLPRDSSVVTKRFIKVGMSLHDYPLINSRSGYDNIILAMAWAGDSCLIS
jgi:ABC-type ATPase involved in cell division